MKDKPNTRHLTTQNTINMVINTLKKHAPLEIRSHNSNLGVAEYNIGLIAWPQH